MYLIAVYALTILLGGVSLYASIRILKRFNWVLAWLRGTVGLFFLAAAFVFVYAAFDLSSYEALLTERPVATVAFEKVDDQFFKVKISYYSDKDDADYEVRGDQWQMDARIIRWTGLVSAAGAKPGFRLDRLSGRYYSLEDERTKPRTVYELNDPSKLMDIWELLHTRVDFFPGIDASYGSAAYLPMADSATFQLSLSHNGLTAKPMNKLAEDAVKMWR